MSFFWMPLSRLAKAGLLTGVAILASASTQAHGALLGLTQNFPDISTFSTLVEYDGAGHFTAVGDPSTYSPDSNPLNMLNISGARSWEIDMYINPLTGEPLSGMFKVEGTIPEIGATSGLLLLGNLWYFGYEDSPDPYNTYGNEFEFVFHAFAGDLANTFLTDPDGPHAGIQLHVGYFDMYDANTNPSGTQYPFTGSFTQPFTNELFFEDVQYGDAYSDTFPSVPEPSAVILLVSGSLMLAWRRLGRRRRAG